MSSPRRAPQVPSFYFNLRAKDGSRIERTDILRSSRAPCWRRPRAQTSAGTACVGLWVRDPRGAFGEPIRGTRMGGHVWPPYPKS